MQAHNPKETPHAQNGYILMLFDHFNDEDDMPIWYLPQPEGKDQTLDMIYTKLDGIGQLSHRVGFEMQLAQIRALPEQQF